MFCHPRAHQLPACLSVRWWKPDRRTGLCFWHTLSQMILIMSDALSEPLLSLLGKAPRCRHTVTHLAEWLIMCCKNCGAEIFLSSSKCETEDVTSQHWSDNPFLKFNWVLFQPPTSKGTQWVSVLSGNSWSFLEAFHKDEINWSEDSQGNKF